MPDVRHPSTWPPSIAPEHDRADSAGPQASSRRDRAPVVLGMSGSVALPEARLLEGRALDAVRRGHRRIVVDLSAVSAIHAGLIGALLRIRRGLTRIDGELTLIVDGPPASELVRTARLDALARIATVNDTAPPLDAQHAAAPPAAHSRPLAEPDPSNARA